jgi:hypothetical protein
MKILMAGNFYSGNKACRELGMRFSPVDTAIYEAVEWFRMRNRDKKGPH